MGELNIEILRSLCRNDKIKWTLHALSRMRERKILSEMVTDAILTGEIIKQYVDDKPYPSCLIFNNNYTAPLHVVASTNGDSVFIITEYVPTTDEWYDDFKTRKTRKER